MRLEGFGVNEGLGLRGPKWAPHEYCRGESASRQKMVTT